MMRKMMSELRTWILTYCLAFLPTISDLELLLCLDLHPVFIQTHFKFWLSSLSFVLCSNLWNFHLKLLLNVMYDKLVPKNFFYNLCFIVYLCFDSGFSCLHFNSVNWYIGRFFDEWWWFMNLFFSLMVSRWWWFMDHAWVLLACLSLNFPYFHGSCVTANLYIYSF